MATAATIAIKLDAQTAELRKEFVKTRSQMQQFGKSMSGNVAAGMAKFTLALGAIKGALAGVRGAINGVIESISRTADLGDFADRIGIGVEQLSALQYAAEQTGASAQVMNTALQRMSRRIAEAAKNGGPLAEELAEVGLNVKALAELSPDQQVLAFSDALKGLNNVGEQNALIMKLMDTEGVALSNTLRNGSEAIIEMGKRAAEAGLTTEEMAERAKEAAAAMKQWNRTWQNFKDVMVAYVLPILTKAIKAITWLINQLRKFFDFGGAGPAANPLEPVSKSATAMSEAVGTAVKEAKKLEEVTKKTVDLKKEMAKVDVAATPGIAALTRTGGAFGAVQAANRERMDRERRHKEMLRVLAEILLAVRTGRIELAPVTI